MIGDGCISIKNNGNTSSVINFACHSYFVLLDLKNYIETNLKIKSRIIEKKTIISNNVISSNYTLVITKTDDNVKLCKFMYKNTNVFLERKHDKFQELLTYIENKSLKKSSKYIGISFHKKSKRWRASIKVNTKKIEIGSFKNELDAVIAYDIVAKSFNRKTNF